MLSLKRLIEAYRSMASPTAKSDEERAMQGLTDEQSDAVYVLMNLRNYDEMIIDQTDDSLTIPLGSETIKLGYSYIGFSIQKEFMNIEIPYRTHKFLSARIRSMARRSRIARVQDAIKSHQKNQ